MATTEPGTPELVYRFRFDVTGWLAVEGERGVESLVDDLCAYGYGREVRRTKRKDAEGRIWSTFEYRLPCDDPTIFDEGAWPYRFREGDYTILSVKLSRITH